MVVVTEPTNNASYALGHRDRFREHRVEELGVHLFVGLLGLVEIGRDSIAKIRTDQGSDDRKLCDDSRTGTRIAEQRGQCSGTSASSM